MAKQSTIRLKKTELPVDRYQAANHATDEMKEFGYRLRALFEKFHTNIEGKTLSGVNNGQKDLFFAKIVTNLNSVAIKLGSSHRQSVGKRVADMGSANAPWVWKVAPETSSFRPNWDRKCPTPDFAFQTDAWLEMRIDFEERIKLDPDVHSSSALERQWIDSEMKKHRKYQALLRYARMLDWACIKNGLPARIKVVARAPHENGGAWIRLGASFQVIFEATYLQGKKYSPVSMLGNKAWEMLPASFDLEAARRGFKGEEGAPLLYGRKFNTTHLILPFSNFVPLTPTSDWLDALISGKRGTNEDIASGKAPLPPEAEIVTLVPLLEKLDDMKRIVTTLMRIAKPYDRISFLPIAG